MKLHFSEMRLFAITLVLCAVPLTAQEQAVPQDLPTQATPTPTTSLIASELHKTSLYASVDALKYPRNLTFDFLQTPTPPKTGKTPVEKIKRAPVDPSMVGYIDNAIVHSEVRIRFDAALHDDTPDRAEFFYAKCGCYRNPAAGANFDPAAPGPGPNVPGYVNFQQLYFYGEYAVNPRFSLFTQLPFRWLQPKPSGVAQAFPNHGGVSDVQLGFKFAVIATPRSYLTLQFRANLPSGNAFNGLGTNHIAAEPGLLYYQRVSDRLSVEAQLMGTLPLSSSAGNPTTSSEGFAGNVLTYGVGPSYLLMNHEEFRLAGVVELVGWNVRGGFVTGRTSTTGVNIVNIKVGPRMSFGSHQSLYFGYGIALTSQTWYREIFRTEYRYAF
jgi:hypothetical protein